MARHIRYACEVVATAGQVFAAIRLGRRVGGVPVVPLEPAWPAARALARIARPALAPYVPAPSPSPSRRRGRRDTARPGSGFTA